MGATSTGGAGLTRDAAQVTGSYGAVYGALPGPAGADYYGRPPGGGLAGAFDAGAAGPSAGPYGGGLGRGGPMLGGGGGISASEEAWRAQARARPVVSRVQWVQTGAELSLSGALAAL